MFPVRVIPGFSSDFTHATTGLAKRANTRILATSFKTYVRRSLPVWRMENQWAQNRALCCELVLAQRKARFCFWGSAKAIYPIIEHYMKCIVGIKEGMTQVFDAKGVCHPATILRVAPAVVTTVRTKEKDGYAAVQIASGEQKAHRAAKAQVVQFDGAKKTVKEFRPRTNYTESVDGFTKGQILDASVFAPGDAIVVSAVSKGKGFQGGVKRHGFAGGRGSHGQKHSHREPGSIGATGFGRVLKGLRMAGRMGGDRITVKNLKVLQVNTDAQIILISGAVPGRKGTVVEIRNV